MLLFEAKTSKLKNREYSGTHGMLLEQCDFQLMPLPHISLSETNVPVMNLPGVSTSKPAFFQALQ